MYVCVYVYVCVCVYTYFYQNLMGSANQKATIATHTQKKKQPKHNTKDGHQTTREENKKGREEKRPTKINPQLRKWH